MSFLNGIVIGSLFVMAIIFNSEPTVDSVTIGNDKLLEGAE